ncbi:MAG TPA: thiamine pyrophosphate-binding protein [Xanthobacteraceae bacterium]|nr:thiamine pyrophosphate-binding protein [Xanthobacteraceae bacterium]
MADTTVYTALAACFAAEGVDTVFALLGDTNMYWAITLAEEHGVRLVHARHENSACAMADGYARATGKVGIATTTCGPGYTNLMTALTAAVRRRSPLIVLAGDTPMSGAFHGQWLDQRPLAEAVGARFVALRDPERIASDVRDAFYFARHERRPVVVSAPLDLQARVLSRVPPYTSSDTVLPRAQRLHPDPAVIAEAAELIASARRPIILAGEGVVRAQAHMAVRRLGDAIGALLATTMRAKGLFEDSPYNLDIAGNYATDLARELFAQADLVLALGAGLGHFTTEAGKLFAQARVIHVDTEPRGVWEGVRVADLHIRADAKVAAEALAEKLASAGTRTGFRTNELADRIANDAPDPRAMPGQPGVLDPRAVMIELDAALPKDFDIALGNAHFTFIALPHLSGRAPERYFTINDFGAIGHALPAAIGIAAARNDGKTVLIEGDGSLMMTVQDLETAARQHLKLLICVINDGGYGAEIHRLRPKGFDAAHTMFGRPDFASIARALGLNGVTVDVPGQFERLFGEYKRAEKATVWDIRVADNIPSRTFRRLYYGES